MDTSIVKVFRKFRGEEDPEMEEYDGKCLPTLSKAELFNIAKSIGVKLEELLLLGGFKDFRENLCNLMHFALQCADTIQEGKAVIRNHSLQFGFKLYVLHIAYLILTTNILVKYSGSREVTEEGIDVFLKNKERVVSYGHFKMTNKMPKEMVVPNGHLKMTNKTPKERVVANATSR
ncbi:Hypothetical predicted protein [Mytilus galloprovincialis]|uniref:Uncharacterized protein n=1 Tax=Mytilus galloprovincialis TaxID=29158 RepID=A0A8B6DWN0_MYTGA|nr:Hypothetical predicted protein [Mytilus galloprovincialis]